MQNTFGQFHELKIIITKFPDKMPKRRIEISDISQFGINNLVSYQYVKGANSQTETISLSEGVLLDSDIIVIQNILS
ncbi:MAG TPA: hypothetical protein PJ990_10695 [Saprospiraceae bacterium]|nr:hypothetical protein [Saprospiraceae bacterium]